MECAVSSEKAVHLAEDCQHFDMAGLKEEIGFIRGVFLMIKGVEKTAINLRIQNQVVIYVFISQQAVADAENDMVLPGEIGVAYKEAAKNKQKLPRLWLLEFRATELAKEFVAKRHPSIQLDFTVFLSKGNGIYVPL